MWNNRSKLFVMMSVSVLYLYTHIHTSARAWVLKHVIAKKSLPQLACKKCFAFQEVFSA